MFALGVAGFGVTSLLCALAPTIEVLVGGPRAPGRGRRAAHARGARGDRRHVPARRARQGDRRLDRVGRDRDRARPAGRRPARRRRVVALDLRDQRADRARHAGRSILRVVPAGARARSGRAGSTSSARCCARSGWPGSTFGLIEQPLHGWGDPLVCGAADRRRRCCSRASSSGRRGRAHPMLPLGAVPAAQLRDRQHRDVRDVRRARRCCSSSSCCSCSRWRATARSQAGTSTLPGDARDVPAVHALRRAGRPLRAALLHGRGAAGRGARAWRCCLRVDADVDYVTDLLPGAARVRASGCR